MELSPSTCGVLQTFYVVMTSAHFMVFETSFSGGPNIKEGTIVDGGVSCMSCRERFTLLEDLI